VDEKVAMTGSANIDMRSLFVNFEIAQMHYTLSDVEQLSEWAKRLLTDCIPYKQAIRDAAFMPSRFTQDLVHLLVPLL
jgi:cardiolipin synthase